MNRHIIVKEFKESLFDSRGLWMITAAAAILSGLCIMVVNIKEGSVLAQNDILQYVIKAALFLTLTVSMVLGSSSFVIEREENTLESLLLTPVSKLSLTMAKYLGVLLIGLLLLLSSLPYLIAVGSGSVLVPSAVLIMFSGGLLLLIAFVAVSIIFSILMNSSKASVLTSILVMAVLTFPAMIQGIFKLSGPGRFILSIDPVACMFSMMGKILTDRAAFSSLGKYFVPLVLFAAVCMLLLVPISGRVALKGEK